MVVEIDKHTVKVDSR